MSIQAFRWAKTWDLRTQDKFVLVMICDHYNEKEKRSWPSRATLATETGLSVRTISRSIVALTELGLLEVEPWVNNHTGAQMSNRYCLPMYDEESSARAELPVHATFDENGSAIAP